MDIIPTPMQANPALPTRSGRTKDFVAVDDVGTFTYCPSETALIQGFEYVQEAASIVDRDGNTFGLALDADRQLRLGPSFGPVEFHWLRQAWSHEQRRHPRDHPLRRFYPAGREALLSGLFETLQLEHGTDPTPGPWTLLLDGTESHPSTLKDVDGRLAHRDQLENALVHDPFGHSYRPVRHGARRLFAHATDFIYYYVEVSTPADGRRPAAV
jgi:hypothetical protein